MTQIDDRIVTIGLEINGQLKTYTNLNIKVTGTKYADPTQDECEVHISNLDNATVNYLLTATSPFNSNLTPKIITVSAGRVSYGTSLIYRGDITAVIVSQPPDITLKIKALTGNFQKGNIVSNSQPPMANFSTIAKQVAADNGLTLNFQALDKQITNYNFTGGAGKQFQKLQDMGAFDVYADNNQLIIKNRGQALNNKVRILNLDTGMIGIPETTEQGIKVKFLLDNQTILGGALQLTSKLYPTLNGTYTVFKLGFEITSREVPFYYIAECTRLNSNG